MLSFDEFKDRLKLLNGINEIKVSGSYHDIEVSDASILFHRGSRTHITSGFKSLKRKNKEQLLIVQLYAAYQNLETIDRDLVKPYLPGPGKHYAPAVAFLKEVKLYDKHGKRIE